MSCGYLYEIRRKSDDIEDSHQHSNLKTFSDEEGDEIWEVPEESFDNAYQQVENEDDDNEVRRENEDKLVATATAKFIHTTNPLNVLQNLEMFSAQKLRLSLSAEQISLKTQQQQWENSNTPLQTINKSINTEVDVTRPMTVVNTNNTSATNVVATTTTSTSTTTTTCSSVKWKNVKINNPNEANENKKSPLSLGNFWAVPIGLSQKPCKVPPRTETEVLLTNVPEIKLNSVKYSRPISSNQKSDLGRKLSLGSVSEEIRAPPKCCTSPESVLDNILSAATSVSVQSSSLSSCILTDDGEQPNRRTSNPFNLGDTTIGDIPKSSVLDFKRFTRDTKSPLNQTHHHCHPQRQKHQPSIMVTHASSSSLSTLNNTPKTSTSSESFETASNISRNLQSEPQEKNTTLNQPAKFPNTLMCQICNDIFKDPRCLNCLHTFCLECIVEENFKQDGSNPFWPISPPQQQQQQYSTNSPHIEQNLKVAHSLHTKSHSTSPELKTDTNNADVFPTATAAVSLHKRPSFSFKLRRSSDHSPSKTKPDVGKTISDISAASNQTQPPTNLSRTIVCKNCQFTTDVPMGGLRQLPRNLLMVRKIDEYRFKMANELRSSCSLCYEETNATHYCDTCTLNLCTLCKESHERQKTTANHNIKNIIELKSNQQEGNDHAKFTLKCSLHQGFEMKSFCTTCLQVACTDCLILQHKGHKVEPIDKAIKCYAKILRESTEQTRLICKTAENSLEKLNTSSLSVNGKFDELQSEVEDFMQRYFEAVEAHKIMLLLQIRRARETKVEMIWGQQVELEKRTQEGQMAIRFSQELIDVASDVEILSFIQLLLKRFEYCQQIKTPVDPKITNTPNFLPKIQATATKDPSDIPVYGIITMQTVEPSLCTLQWDGFSQLRLNKKVELTLISRDAEGQPMCHGGLKIQSHVKYKDLNSKCLRMEVSDNSDGTYCIAFTPDSEGTILLMITINEKHIKGSPYSFLARPVRPHSGVYHCCTFCSSKGNKFATCSCEGNMPGYSGCGHGHTGHPGRRHWSCCGDVLRNSECYFANRSLNPK